ncbi:MAG: nucleotide exchange factor GrpE [Bacilli bacterium]|nr:nucleotide exchange factor GrpE [Bacilli bacterium]
MKDNKVEEKVNKKVKINKESKELDKLNNELAYEKEKSMRIQAEMINFRRRSEEEKSILFKYANEDIITSLLPIIDNFERGISLDDNDLSDEVSKFLSGFKMIFGNFKEILNKFEVKEIEADGIEFNPCYHEAILTEKDENKPSGVILEVLQKGYIYKDKVLRPAMVKVNE